MTTISPFFTRLAAERSPERFERAAAHLLTFELYTRVHNQGEFSDASATAADEIRARLSGGEHRPTEVLLCSVLAALPAWGEPATARVAALAVYSAWVEYAELLIGDAVFDVAAFVLRTVGAHAELDGYKGLSAQARAREGLALASQAKWEEAEWVYGRAWELGRASKHWSVAYRAQLGRVNVLRQRGNLPAAEALLQEVISTGPRRAPDILPRALSLRGSIAHTRGHVDDAVVWAGRALEVAEDEVIRMRILVDLASFMADVSDARVANVARQALEYVAVNATDRRVRLHATVNLLSQAVESRREDAFRALRASIPVAALTPQNTAYYWLFVAEGCRVFGIAGDRVPALDEAERVAREYGLAQLQFMVDAERGRESERADTLTAASEESAPPVPRLASARVLRAVNRVSRALATAS